MLENFKDISQRLISKLDCESMIVIKLSVKFCPPLIIRAIEIITASLFHIIFPTSRLLTEEILGTDSYYFSRESYLPNQMDYA